MAIRWIKEALNHEKTKLKKFDESRHWESLWFHHLRKQKQKIKYAQMPSASRSQSQKEKINSVASKWRTNNPSKISAIRARHRKNPNRRLAMSIRVRVLRVLKGNLKSKPTLKLLGCSVEQLKLHIQSKFSSSMSWSNYGQWHIDHVIPCAAFELSEPDQQRKCFHFSNLQPLWKDHNLQKADKIIPSQPELLISMI